MKKDAFNLVMECLKFLSVEKVQGKRTSRFKRKGGKLTRAVYAGLIVCFVPSVLCQEWSRRLTFDEIYNDTSYVQLQHTRPYRITEYSYDVTHIHPLEDKTNGHSHNTDYGKIVPLDSHRFNVEDKRIATSYTHTLHTGGIADGINIDELKLTNLEDHRFNPDNTGIRNYDTKIPDFRTVTHDKEEEYVKITNSHRINTEGSQIHSQRPISIEENPGGSSLKTNLGDQRGLEPEFLSEEDYKGNEVDSDIEVTVRDIVKEPLLVGFSHDPFRYSIPEEDYLKGVRDMTPKSIMNKGENRGKRGVLHLYNMMYCATGCEPLAYKGYGCYCGFLGSGKPTDGIDRCCKMHDECYENIYCPFFTVYFQPYYWKCYRNQPLCALENYHTQHQFINGCAARLCECDRRFAMCVKRYACPRRRALCRSSPLRLLQNLLMF